MRMTSRRAGLGAAIAADLGAVRSAFRLLRATEISGIAVRDCLLTERAVISWLLQQSARLWTEMTEPRVNAFLAR
jgi:hypothetical protein